jgi:hypothetical protein
MKHQFLRTSPLLAILMLGIFGLLTGCDKGPEPLVPATLSGAQKASLHSMNEAGSQAFWGWTWRYELGENCLLRVTRDFEGKTASVADHPLRGAITVITPYATVGFGVKATASKGISADLFDTDSEANAQQFATHARQLIEGCV